MLNTHEGKMKNRSYLDQDNELKDFVRTLVNDYLNDTRERASTEFYNDDKNSYKYIVFVLIIYAVSFLALMIKYFWRSRDETRWDNMYDEFVNRDKFKAGQDTAVKQQEQLQQDDGIGEDRVQELHSDIIVDKVEYVHTDK